MTAPTTRPPVTRTPVARGASVVTTTDDDRSLGEVVSALGHDVTELIQAQVELAKVELRDQAKEVGKAGAFGGGAAALGLAALILVGMAIAWGIAEAWPIWTGFAIVGVLYAVLAAVLGAMTRQHLSEATDGPNQTKQTLKEDAEWLRQHRS